VSPLSAAISARSPITRRYCAHAPIRKYLNRENVGILEAEINAFKERLARWCGPRDADIR
jgi:hypothetical protein